MNRLVLPHWRGWLKLENRCLITHQAFANFARDFPSLVGR
jgi:hypothetical protein